MGHIVLPEEHFAADVQRELAQARWKFGWWPQNPVEAAAIVNEEAGEVVKGINNWHHGHGDDTPEEIYKEAVQAAAMLVRFVTETPLFRNMWDDLK